MQVHFIAAKLSIAFSFWLGKQLFPMSVPVSNILPPVCYSFLFIAFWLSSKDNLFIYKHSPSTIFFFFYWKMLFSFLIQTVVELLKRGHFISVKKKKWSLFSGRFVFHGWLTFLDERYQHCSMSSLLMNVRESTRERDVNISK